MMKLILLLLFFANTVYGAQAYRIPAAPVITKATTGNRPTGEEGQWYSNSTLHLPQYHDNTTWYSFLLAGQASIVNADVNASAAIAYSKLNLTGAILNADINASAAIAYSKLNLATSIVNADVNASAAIAYSKLNLSGAVNLASDVTGTLPATKGGTGVATYTLGDILYSSAANTLAKLAGNTTAGTQLLSQTGDGVNSAAPVWLTTTSASTASTVVARDSSQGFSAGKISAVFAPLTSSVVTAAGTTTLTSTSSQQEIFTGATTQTVVLPVVTTLQNGYYYRIVNLSSGQVTVQTSGANSLQVMGPSSELIATVLDTTAGTGTASWTTKYSGLASGGGGGGSAVKWFAPVDGTAPLESSVSTYGVQSWAFSNSFAGTERLYAFLKVPNSYVAGNPIKIKAAIYSASSSNTILISSTCYLLGKAASAITSSTNSYASTNAALTNSIANAYREADLDCSSSTGTINSVAVAAGDLIRVILTRGSGSDTADLNFIPDATEVTFQ